MFLNSANRVLNNQKLKFANATTAKCTEITELPLNRVVSERESESARVGERERDERHQMQGMDAKSR